jgi:hypothetical protein
MEHSLRKLSANDRAGAGTVRRFALSFAGTILVWAAPALAQDSSRRFEDFSADPQWESFRSRLLPNPIPITRQDFGWRKSERNGHEIGGWVQRSLTPAWFAKVISKRTLNDKLSASGKFIVTKDAGNSGTLFGWFNETSRGWRTPNSLVFRLDGNGGKYWVFFEYGTQHWLTGGEGCFEGERYQTTPTKPFRADGTTHIWSLAYDPDGANGNGLMTFALDGKTFTHALAPGHKADGAEFNRFGVFNQQNTGSGMDVGFRDLTIEGQPIDLSSDAGWEGHGNKVEFADRHMRPFHDFGWMPSSKAGGRAGEIGGVIWRDEKPACYATKVGPLTLDDELFASGKIAFNGAGSDSGVYLGWFNSSSKTNKVTADYQEPQKNVLAIIIEGPSRIGHYFRAEYRAANGKGSIDEAGPIIRPDGRVHQWSIRYLPQSAQITVRLDDDVRVLAVSAEHRTVGATFDRFGLFNIQVGGHFVDIAADELTYTAKPD